MGVNWAKILGGPESEHLGLGFNPHTAKDRVGLGMEGHWIGLQILFIDSLEWDMKNVGYEKAEFSEICKWK